MTASAAVLDTPVPDEAEKAPAPPKKPRKPNPKCGGRNCNHPMTFHGRRDPKTHRRKCNAFGCDCKNWVTPKDET